jgi:UDP-N-acetylmuramoylalanine--D-glutamate ligase
VRPLASRRAAPLLRVRLKHPREWARPPVHRPLKPPPHPLPRTEPRRKSGRSAARLALARGASVVGVDVNPECAPLEGDPDAELPPGVVASSSPSLRTFGRILRTELGPHRDATFAEADVIVLSPGVPLTQPQVAAALAEGRAEILSELAFASASVPPSVPTVAVTGTNGKSTVCTFVGQLMRACGARPFVGGNLGDPLSDCALAFELAGTAAAETDRYDACVVECSSYQLEHPGSLRFDAACVLNLTPDHMERHGSVEAYAAAKARAFAWVRGEGTLAALPLGGAPTKPASPAAAAAAARTDWNVVGAEMLTRARERVIAEASNSSSNASNASKIGGDLARLGALPGVIVDLDAKTATIRLPRDDPDAVSVVDLAPLTAVGAHNAENAGAALLLAHAADPARFTASALAAGVSSLSPPPHRMTLVAVTDGDVRWVDDSKATNVEAAAAGLSGYDRRAVVLLGGVAKEGVGPGGVGLGFAGLAPALRRHLAVVAFGASRETIAEELAAEGLEPIAVVPTMAEAMEVARGIAPPGGAVVLSPACASFDEFRNFAHRGDVFAELAGGAATRGDERETPRR